MKKIWRVLLLTLCLSLVSPVYASFQDLGESDVNFEAIDFLRSQGIISGYPDGTFRPDATLNRAELTKIVVESSDVEISEDEECFPDLVEGSWYAKYVCTAFELGVVEGYPDGTFKPSQEINRAEAVKIILEAEGLELKEGSSYVDVKEGQWYELYVDTAYDLNYLPYLNSFGAGEDVLRRNFSEMYYRAIKARENIDRVYEVSVSLDEPYYSDVLIGDSVELDQLVPRYVLVNEVYYFEGKVVGPGATLNIEDSSGGGTVFLGSPGEEFSMPVWFGSKGTYNLKIAGKSFEIQALGDAEVDGVMSEDVSSEVEVSTYQNDIVLDQKGLGDYLKKYEFIFENSELTLLNRQSSDSLIIPNDWLSDMWGGEVVVEFVTSVSDFDVNLKKRSEYKLMEERDLEIVEQFEIILNNIEDENIGYSYESGGDLYVSFDALVAPDRYLYVIRESGQVDVIEDIVQIDGMEVSMTYSPARGALYEIIEINDVNGRALVNYPIYRKGVLPIADDPYDTTGIALEASVENALRILNEDRAKFGLNGLVLNDDLSRLAQYHADDMAENKYVSHADLEGMRVEDRKSDFGIVTLVGENIARNTELAGAQSSLMRSAAHRINILDTNWTEVGFGIAFDEDGALYLVQNFSFDSTIGMDELRLRIESELSVGENVDLVGVSEIWSRVMSEAQSFGVEINGRNLNDEIVDYDYLLPAKAYTGIFTVVSQIDEYLEDRLSEIVDQGFNYYGFDVRLGDDGQLYFVLIVGG